MYASTSETLVFASTAEFDAFIAAISAKGFSDLTTPPTPPLGYAFIQLNRPGRTVMVCSHGTVLTSKWFKRCLP